MTISRQHDQSGFTVIELIVVVAVLLTAAVVTAIQISNINATNQDTQRKTAVNAMYYALEEVYYQQHKSYPASIDSKTLPAVDPALFTDPDGFTLGKETLTEDEVKALINNGDTSADTQQRLASLSAGKSPNFHYDATDCDTSGNCKGYTLRADMTKEAEYIKKNRSH